VCKYSVECHIVNSVCTVYTVSIHCHTMNSVCTVHTVPTQCHTMNSVCTVHTVSTQCHTMNMSLQYRTVGHSIFRVSYSPFDVSRVSLLQYSSHLFGLHFPLCLFSIWEMS
jgi:hypothetical protein